LARINNEVATSDKTGQQLRAYKTFGLRKGKSAMVMVNGLLKLIIWTFVVLMIVGMAKQYQQAEPTIYSPEVIASGLKHVEKLMQEEKLKQVRQDACALGLRDECVTRSNP
jgi:hypothetical protein